MKILDLSAGKRAIWFNKNHPFATYLDIRPEMNPTIVCDTRSLPSEVGDGYDLICWDPPHLNVGANSDMAARYGYWTTAHILDTVKKTSIEAWRVSKPNALMAFKWNDHSIRLDRVLALMPQWEPLFGHHLKNRGGPSAVSQSFWVMLRRLGIPRPF